MLQDRKLSIYCVEFPVIKANSEIQHYHSALFLMDEGQSPPQVLQQLHYSENSNDFFADDIRMYPYVRMGINESISLNKLHLFLLIDGHESEILAMWNHALRHSLRVREDNLIFDSDDKHLPHANNCRAGVISAILSLGIDVRRDYFKADGGTKAGRIEIRDIFSSLSRANRTLSEIRSENNRLTEALIPYWEQNNGPTHYQLTA